MTSFERGFVGVGKIQNAFSIHFFLIIVIFVIFDLEVIIFIRLIASSFYRGLLFLIFWIFALVSLYLEWAFGKLTWLV